MFRRTRRNVFLCRLFNETDTICFTYLHLAAAIIGEAMSLRVVVTGWARIVSFHLFFHVVESLLTVSYHWSRWASLLEFSQIYLCVG